MSESWQKGFQRAMLRMFVKHGSKLMRPDPDMHHCLSPVSFLDGRSILEHFAACGVDLAKNSQITEMEWTEVLDTFDEGKQKYGVCARLSCECGVYKDIQVSLEGSFSEIMFGILREE